MLLGFKFNSLKFCNENNPGQLDQQGFYTSGDHHSMQLESSGGRWKWEFRRYPRPYTAIWPNICNKEHYTTIRTGHKSICSTSTACGIDTAIVLRHGNGGQGLPTLNACDATIHFCCCITYQEIHSMQGEGRSIFGLVIITIL